MSAELYRSKNLNQNIYMQGNKLHRNKYLELFLHISFGTFAVAFSVRTFAGF